MSETDLTAKVIRARNWLKDHGLYKVRLADDLRWQVLMDGQVQARGLSDAELIAFCEDRGWQDQEQEADGVEWEIEGEWAVTSAGVWLKLSHRAASDWEWEAWAPCVDTIRGTAPTRAEARHQAAEAARGMG